MEDKKRRIRLFVPGRLCLFGEHSDWAGASRALNSAITPGRAIVTGTQQGIYATAEKAKDFIVTCSIPEMEVPPFICPMDVSQLREEAHKGDFYSYVAGVASYICEWYRTGGLHINITAMDLPMKKGLSSSAAVCVLTARAFNELYELHLNTKGIMNIAYWGEQRTPSRCGRLDQACAYGVRPVSMTFDGNEISVERIPVRKTLFYVFADLMAKKDTVRILSDLNRAYPFPETDAEKKLHEALGKENEEIVSLAEKFIAEGNAECLGALMTQAQTHFDQKITPMSPEQLRAPVLHSVLEDSTVKELTYGGKGVGSQGDGTVQLLAKNAQAQNKLIAYLQNKRGMTAYPLTLKANQAVRKAVIPVAGFGTRLYPETRFVKKEFCPVVDRDGLVKPLLLVLLEELDSIEIEEICLILNPEEEQMYRSLLFSPVSEKHYGKLPLHMQEYEDKIQKIIRKVQFVFQNEPRGFGDAVFQAAEFAAGEPVLLMLGDTIYQSTTGVPCTKQLIDAYEMFGRTTVAVHTIPNADTGNFGIFSGTWESNSENVFRCTKITEKPTPDFAREYLRMWARNGEEQYFGAFGAYVLTDEVFKRLNYAVEHNIVNSKNEVELTDALSYVNEESAVFAFVPEGKSYDLGNAEAYRKTVAEFGKKKQEDG